jgi:hypothetical protein
VENQTKPKQNNNNKKKRGLGWSSVVEYLPSMCKALGVIPTVKKKYISKTLQHNRIHHFLKAGQN